MLDRRRQRSQRPAETEYDAVVAGAGFGGLGAALALAEAGARVLLCESLAYPGGCASTFERDGYRFESGATLFSGLGPGQLFDRWIRRHGLDVEVDWIDPLVELRTPDWRLAVGRDRSALLRDLAAFPGAPRERLEAFFALQQRVADTLWEVLDEPRLLPPLGPAALAAHLKRAPRYVRLLPWVGRPLRAVLDRLGLSGFEPLETYLEALCQITVQCGVDRAEAPLALAAVDYYYRRTGHVRGGIGRLAWGLLEAIEGAGGEVSLTNPVRGLRRVRNGWRVTTRRGEVRARSVLANVLPQNLRALLGAEPGTSPALDARSRRLEDGWGACMLYLVARPPAGAPAGARHLELVGDPAQPFTLGNHAFCSISGAEDPGRAPGRPGELRTITVSTHVPVRELQALPESRRGEWIAGIQERTAGLVARLAPEWHAGLVHSMTASPRTFERFTGRHLGLVGGIPRQAGLKVYTDALGGPVLPGLQLVGDSVFPGQSILAAALGGTRAAARMLLSLIHI